MSKFSDVIKSDTPVLVDFYADWCMPCKTLDGIIKQVKSIFGDNLKIIKVDIDKNQAVAHKYQIKGVPTLILFHKGKQLWRQSGVMSKEQLSRTIQQHIP